MKPRGLIKVTTPLLVAVQTSAPAMVPGEVGMADQAPLSVIQNQAARAPAPKSIAPPAGELGSSASSWFKHRFPIPSSDKWTKREAKRFQQLVTKEALATITRQEASELEHLDNLRSRKTGEEILAIYRRQKADEEIHRLLSSYAVDWNTEDYSKA